MGTGEEDWQLRTGSVLAEDLRLVPSTLVWRLTATCNSGSRGSCILFWPPEGAGLTDTHPHIDIIKNKTYGLESRFSG